MRHFLSEIDEVTLTFSDICTTRDGMEFIRIYFERPREGGFDFLESALPMLNIKDADGFTENERQRLLDYAKTNAFLIWGIAREEAVNVAASV